MHEFWRNNLCVDIEHVLEDSQTFLLQYVFFCALRHALKVLTQLFLPSLCDNLLEKRPDRIVLVSRDDFFDSFWMTLSKFSFAELVQQGDTELTNIQIGVLKH